MWNKILIISLYFSCAQYFLGLDSKNGFKSLFLHLFNKFYGESEKLKYVFWIKVYSHMAKEQVPVV